MKTSHRIVLFSAFAAAGAGLAVCIGLTVLPPPPATEAPRFPVEGGHADAASRKPASSDTQAMPPAPAKSKPAQTVARPNPPNLRDLFAETSAAKPKSPGPSLPAARQQSPYGDVLAERIKPLGGAPLNNPLPSYASSPRTVSNGPSLRAAEVPSGGSGAPRLGSEIALKPASVVPDNQRPRVPSPPSADSAPPQTPRADSVLPQYTTDGGQRALTTPRNPLTANQLRAARSDQGEASQHRNVLRNEAYRDLLPSLAEFQELKRPLETLATRVYQARYLSVAEVHALVLPLLTPRVGSAQPMIRSRTGSDREQVPEAVVARDYPAVLDQIGGIVAELDAAPAQIAVEALVLRVQLKGTATAVDFEMLAKNRHVVPGPNGAQAPQATFAVGAGPMKYGLLDGGVPRLLDTLALIGPTKIVANPRFAAVEQRFVEVPLEDLAGRGRDRSEKNAVDGLPADLAVRLRVRAMAYGDGAICMELHCDNPGSHPQLEQRAIASTSKANIIVPNGATAVLGGYLIQPEPLKNASSRQDFLQYVGLKAKSPPKMAEGQEILVLLTPRLNPDAARTSFAAGLPQDAKAAIASRYVGAAHRTCVADRNAALHLVAAAIRLNPMDRTARDLRNWLWADQPGGTAHAVAHTIPAPGSQRADNAQSASGNPVTRVATLPTRASDSDRRR